MSEKQITMHTLIYKHSVMPDIAHIKLSAQTGEINKTIIAQKIAEYIVENGYLLAHEGKRRIDSDLIDFRFTIAIGKPKLNLP